MNIKSRLRKLENEMIGGSTVCSCSFQNKFETYYQDLSSDSENTEPVLLGEPMPDLCTNCRKPIEKQQIIIQGVDGTTKDRFPEQWQAK